METIAANIAANPWLQTLTIFVAIGTLVLFLVRNLPQAVRFILDALSNGWKKAVRHAASPAHERAKLTYFDSRLVLIESMRMMFNCATSLATLPIVYLIVIFFIQFLQLYEIDKSPIPSADELVSWKGAIIVLFSGAFAVAITYYTYRPIIMMQTYFHSVTRLVQDTVDAESGTEEADYSKEKRKP